MDKSWMHPTVGRSNRKYILGCEEFVNWAWDNRHEEFGDEIYCPCVRCINKVLRPKDVVRDHILNKGIVRSYIRWTKHGEGDEVDARHDSNDGDDMHQMLQDALGFPDLVGTDKCTNGKRRRENPNGDENGGKWVRGTSTLPKVLITHLVRLKPTWNGNNQPDGPDTHPSLFVESMGVLMTSSHRFDWTKYWEQQGGDDKLWLWNTLKVISERNKRNRSRQIAKHTSGRKGFPEMRAQIIREEGAPPSQGDFFVLSHTSRKTNDALDGQSREKKMKELAGRDENGNQQPLSDEIYRQVMPRERHGRRRVMGRVAQEKEEERQRELDEIKRGFNARYEAIEARFMETLMQRTSLSRML
ncbi:hypothetical protein IFM89_024549 [Coptis chinensis]|uniref:Transposase-associated domain-containing protein n=1 Tax=Coptis chinensis TaxID=261450 RepID=A0A835LNC7_9MAGN|nr:hypothetical protein IFM89_024549 [Coptis chinensis]